MAATFWRSGIRIRTRRASNPATADRRKVSLDALHIQDQTARELVLEHGADFLLTVKDNQPTVRANIQRVVQRRPPISLGP